MENVHVAYNFSHFAIFLPKFIKIGGNVTEFKQKQKCSLFETPCISSYLAIHTSVSDFLALHFAKKIRIARSYNYRSHINFDRLCNNNVVVIIIIIIIIILYFIFAASV